MGESLRTCRTLAMSTFRRGLRGRMAFLMIVSILTIIALGHVFRGFQENRGLEMRLVLEMGLALSTFVVLGSALLLASQGPSLGADRRSLLPLLALPVPREAIYLGSILGFAATLAVYCLGLASTLSIVLWWRFSTFRWALLLHFGTLFLEALVLVSIAGLLSLGRSPIVAFFGTSAVALLSHGESLVRNLLRDSPSWGLSQLVPFLLHFLPNLSVIDVKGAAVAGRAVEPLPLVQGSVHLLLYIAVVLVLASQIYRRREA